jgi:small ligand-binding sensory domain FIST
MSIHRASGSGLFASALSLDADWRTGLDDVCRESLSRLEGTPDLAFLFLSAERGEHADAIAEAVSAHLGTDRILGCTAESVVGGDCEIEGEPRFRSGSDVFPTRS